MQTKLGKLGYLLCLLSLTFSPAALLAAEVESSVWDKLTQPAVTAYQQGKTELYVPLHTHHIRSAYTPEKIASFQENPWGLGVGKGYYAANGDYHGVYVMGFQDSHFKPEWIGGYAWRTHWQTSENTKLGLGATMFITARSDIGHYTPFPGILPTASLHYKQASLEMTYLPGGKGNGNILFFWGKWQFGQ